MKLFSSQYSPLRGVFPPKFKLSSALKKLKKGRRDPRIHAHISVRHVPFGASQELLTAEGLVGSVWARDETRSRKARGEFRRTWTTRGDEAKVLRVDVCRARIELVDYSGRVFWIEAQTLLRYWSAQSIGQRGFRMIALDENFLHCWARVFLQRRKLRRSKY